MDKSEHRDKPEWILLTDTLALLNPVAIVMFFFSLLSKLFNKVSSSHGGSASAMHPTVFRCCQLSYHLVQKCLCCPANLPGTPDSRRNCHSTLCSVDIHDAFTTQPLPWDVQGNPQVGPHRHPNHKSCLTRTQCPSPPWQARVQGSRGRQGFRQKPSRSLRQGLKKPISVSWLLSPIHFRAVLCSRGGIFRHHNARTSHRHLP